MDNKRELIFRATEKIIASKGLQGLSMQQIANEAGVAAGTIYRYFKDKEELISELRKHVLREVASNILVDCQEGNLEQRFKRIWFNIVDFGRQRTPANLSYEQYIHLPGIDSDPHQAFEKSTFQGLHQLFEAGRVEGIFHNLQNKVMFAISLEPSMALGRSIRRGQIEYDKNELEVACDICWKTLLK
ncbi:TetR/AcrR family transcriptional regulator [Shewanella sp. D64]|uniref:TetR/AcrR family transcriptional regulator n=1 Tax=unclassified Shewanella TaxID=196818 RepID=UPI0022BA62FB|nr:MULTISPECIES: TetR/AcrR family transcriptional regulator [unclassified Shewanella]MEC4727368.1 TetR/AcrR family transcriptional regulator [Shewanella sp. D64]MEC4739523.1 TetR/AcrR family transcriptional regulator [Shewanella sp. E94]WBJ96093.1 TetR/AcrR family transcriptional regulator [Shewanella sp. MTB7]